MPELKSNISYALVGQVVSIASSIIRVLALPIVLSVASFGYWQIYVFYYSFLGLFSLGFNDGLYLKYGKFDYNELPFMEIRSASLIFLIFLVFLSTLLIPIMHFSFPHYDFIIFFILFNISLVVFNGICFSLLQSTNSIKTYSIFFTLDKFFMMLMALIMCLFNFGDYKLLIITDSLIRFFISIGLLVKFKHLFLGTILPLKKSFDYLINNIKIGYKLLVANLSSMIIMSIGRLFIQFFVSIEIFAIYSFGIILTNFMMSGITAISTVLYPHYSRTNSSDLSIYFEKINSILKIINPFLLLIYYPLFLFVSSFYTEYISVFDYFVYLICAVPISAKMSILNNTFYKILRYENRMLWENIVSIGIFILCCSFLISLNPSVKVVAISSLISLMYRCYASEIYLRKKLKLKVRIYDILKELFPLILLILLSNYFSAIILFLVYFCYICLLYYHNRELISKVLKIKSIAL